MATGFFDANNIWRYGEDDLVSSPNWSGYMDKAGASMSALMTDLKAAGQWGIAANQAIATGTFVQFGASTVLTTPGGMSNSSGAITVTKAGTYEVHVQAIWQAAAGARRIICVTKGATAITPGGAVTGGTLIGSQAAPPVSASFNTVQTYRTPRVVCAAGDVVRVFGFQDTGGSINLLMGANTAYEGQTTISAYRVS